MVQFFVLIAILIDSELQQKNRMNLVFGLKNVDISSLLFDVFFLSSKFNDSVISKYTMLRSNKKKLVDFCRFCKRNVDFVFVSQLCISFPKFVSSFQCSHFNIKWNSVLWMCVNGIGTARHKTYMKFRLTLIGL